MTNESIKKATRQYRQLVKLVNDLNKTYSTNGYTPTSKELKQLSALLGGHNLNEEQFDYNYGVLCATIKLEDNKFIVHNFVEVWENDDYEELIFLTRGNR